MDWGHPEVHAGVFFAHPSPSATIVHCVSDIGVSFAICKESTINCLSWSGASELSKQDTARFLRLIKDSLPLGQLIKNSIKRHDQRQSKSSNEDDFKQHPAPYLPVQAFLCDKQIFSFFRRNRTSCRPLRATGYVLKDQQCLCFGKMGGEIKVLWQEQIWRFPDVVYPEDTFISRISCEKLRSRQQSSLDCIATWAVGTLALQSQGSQ